MKTEDLSPRKNKLSIIKRLPKPLKILVIVCAGLALLVLLLSIGNFVYCSTVAICDYARPKVSPEMIATQMPIQYEYAIQDINAGRLQEAKQRLSYIMFRAPEYPGAKEKLAAVEQLLTVTPTP
jgi:hypothetical protein